MLVDEIKLYEFCRKNKSMAKEMLMRLACELTSQKTNIPVNNKSIAGIKRAHNVLFNNSIINTHFISSDNLEKIVGFMRIHIA